MSLYANAINVIHMTLVVAVFLMVAFDKFPRNQLVSQKNFLIGLAVIVFAYHSFKLFMRNCGQNTEGLEVCPPPRQVQEMTVEQGMSDVALTGANIHHIRVFDSDPGYSHPSLKVNVGDVVVWTNVGEHVHSVTATKRTEWLTSEKMESSCEFNSGLMKPGQTYAVKFTQKGWFPYFCLEHRGWMQGEIHVE
jgi:plastocyanin